MDPMKLRRRINAIDIEILKILSRDSGIEITRLARVIGLSPLN
jgi:DNA-binding Lrp family transcriptional regulator